MKRFKVVAFSKNTVAEDQYVLSPMVQAESEEEAIEKVLPSLNPMPEGWTPWEVMYAKEVTLYRVTLVPTKPREECVFVWATDKNDAIHTAMHEEAPALEEGNWTVSDVRQV